MHSSSCRQPPFFVFCCVLVALNLLRWSFESFSFRLASNGLKDFHDQAKKKPHDPLLGARHQDGSLGLIVDPSPNRLLAPYHVQPNKQTVCNVGIEGQGGRQVLNKVRTGVVAYQSATRNKAMHGESSTARRQRLLCMVYTHEPAHANVRAIARTWGRQCDGFFAASNFTDERIGAVNLLHRGPEAYGNMWQKVRSMWAYAYHHFRNDYDYFYICGDDVYLVVDNMRAYLEGEQIKLLLKGNLDVFSKLNKNASQWKTRRPRPLLLGIPMNFRMMVYPSGGCGYVLNRAGLDLLAQRVLEDFLPNATDPREDVFVGSALWEHGVSTADSRDEKGAFRFGGNAEELYNFDGVRSVVLPKVMKRRYGVEMYKGMKGVSSETISFHLKGTPVPDMILRYHTLLQGYCDSA